MKNLIYILFVISLFIAGCGDNAHDEPTDENKEESETVELTGMQMETAGIKLGKLEKRNMRNMIKANGILELPPQNKANISPLMGGTVKDILVIEGDFVEEGQTLVKMQHPDFIQLQQDYLEAVNKQNFLKVDYERKKSLYGENISSGKEFQKVEMEYKTNISQIKSLKAKLEMLNLNVAEIENNEIAPYFILKAPFHGYIRNIETSIGAFVEPNETIIEILDNHHIHIDLLVYENDINKIEEGQTVTFKVTSSKDFEYKAKVFAVGKAFEDELKAVRVHAEIENPDNELLPGMYVDARIIIDNAESYVLPETALLREGDANYIFVQEEDNADEDHSENEEHFRFRKLPVKIGVIDRGYTEIFPSAGIRENSVIVLEGSYYIDAEMNKGEGGHHH